MKTAPGTFSRKRFPPCGRTAVTPVRTLSPRTRVVCPTRTPSTSVIAFSGPGGSTPTMMPASRARGLFWVNADETIDKTTRLKMKLFIFIHRLHRLHRSFHLRNLWMDRFYRKLCLLPTVPAADEGARFG